MSTDVSVTTPVPAARSAAQAESHPARARRRLSGRRRTVLALRVAIFVVLIGGWELCARTGFVDPFFFGEPTKILSQLQTWVQHGTEAGTLWEQVFVTLEEAVLGFIIGVVLGVVCGITLGRVPLLAEIFAPYIKVMNSIPRIVLGSIFILWLGLGLSSKVALAVVLVFFAVFFNAFQGAREVDRNLVANARILGASRRQVTRHVVLPSAMTWIIASMHTAFGFALIGAIVGEFLGAQRGLGLLISQAQGTFNADGVFAAMVIIAVVALAAEALITLLERRLLSWRPPAASSAADAL
ncbi:MAG: sulfonate transport system permease protein [Solirubrobacteraceae bacterium]|jgi:NitT/TauT family transport system permease protein|nr:sulfonate transport system permease protein [Solirubrobacteraceae bacterium]